MKTHGVIRKPAMIRSAIRDRKTIKPLRHHPYTVSRISPSSSINSPLISETISFPEARVKLPGGTKHA